MFRELNELYTPTVRKILKIPDYEDLVYDKDLPHPVDVMIRVLGHENTWDLFELMKLMADEMRQMVKVTLEDN